MTQRRRAGVSIRPCPLCVTRALAPVACCRGAAVEPTLTHKLQRTPAAARQGGQESRQAKAWRTVRIFMERGLRRQHGRATLQA